MDPNRRQFIAAGATAAAASACAGCPLLAAVPAREKGPVDVGPLKDFAADGTTDRWAASDGFFVVRRRGRLYAVSSRCTHKKVQLVVAKGDGGFKCPRHGSTFDPGGHVTKSPAHKALPRFSIRLKGEGHVVVDTSKQIGERDWDLPGGFVDLDAHS